MPRVFALLLMILLLLVASCAGPEVVEVLPTAVAELPTAAATLAPPTETSTAVPTATATELPTETPTLRPTATPRPTDLPPTETATATVVYAPPTGSLYFLLGDDDIFTLYQSQFSTPNEWDLQPILENLVATYEFLFSPSQQQIAYRMVEDSNKDGHVSGASHDMGEDRKGLYVYDLATEINTALPFSDTVFDFYWLNEETIAFRANQLFYAPVNGSEAYEPSTLFSDSYIQWLKVSPNRQYIIASLSEPTDQIILFDVIQDSALLILPNLANSMVSWSPNNRFLFLHKYADPEHISLLIDLNTLEQTYLDIPFKQGFPVWNLDSTSIFFVQNMEQEQTELAQIYLDTKEWLSLTTLEGQIIRQPRMSPDGNSLIFSTKAEYPILNIWDIQTNSLQILPPQTPNHPLYLDLEVVAWSPDSEWFLHIEWDMGSPFFPSTNWWLYLTHVPSLQSNLVLWGENTPYPHNFQWFP